MTAAIFFTVALFDYGDFHLQQAVEKTKGFPIFSFLHDGW